MSKEIKDINNEILRVTHSVVVYRQEYSKFGGYEGDKEIYTMDVSKALYNAGYRKQSEGTWVARICEFTDGSIMAEDYYCSKCFYETFDNEKNFCPNCGAKMKGGDGK